MTAAAASAKLFRVLAHVQDSHRSRQHEPALSRLSALLVIPTLTFAYVGPPVPTRPYRPQQSCHESRKCEPSRSQGALRSRISRPPLTGLLHAIFLMLIRLLQLIKGFGQSRPLAPATTDKPWKHQLVSFSRGQLTMAGSERASRLRASQGQVYIAL